jgi:hypothetical protein
MLVGRGGGGNQGQSCGRPEHCQYQVSDSSTNWDEGLPHEFASQDTTAV